MKHEFTRQDNSPLPYSIFSPDIKNKILHSLVILFLKFHCINFTYSCYKCANAYSMESLAASMRRDISDATSNMRFLDQSYLAAGLQPRKPTECKTIGS